MVQSAHATIDQDFVETVNELRAKFDGSGRQAEQYFEDTLASKDFFRRQFFQDLFKDVSTEQLCEKLDVKSKLALVAACRRPSKQNAASELANLVSGDSAEFRTSNEKFKGLSGFHRYWRYYPTIAHPGNERVRWGIIKFDAINDRYMTFSHWSHDEVQRRPLQENGVPFSWDKFSEPSDTGFAFLASARVFCLGFRPQNIRMVVVNIPDDPVDKALFNGIMITTRKRSRTVFAAGFVMVHQSNPVAKRDMKYDEFRREVGLTINSQTLIIHS